MLKVMALNRIICIGGRLTCLPQNTMLWSKCGSAIWMRKPKVKKEFSLARLTSTKARWLQKALISTLLEIVPAHHTCGHRRD